MANRSSDKPSSITILDVAREAGVSYSTVSRVLSGYEFVKDETRQRVQDAAQRLGYVVNQQARSLAGGKSNVIGLLVPGLDNGYISEIARGIDEEIVRLGYDLLLYTTRRDLNREASYVLKLTKGLADGLLLVVPLLTPAYIQTLQHYDFPYVLIDQSDPSNRSSVVDCTNWQGAYDATRYLIDLGHRRIGLITGLMGLNSAVERLEGYRAALLDHEIPFDPALVAEGDFWQAKGYQAAQKLLQLSPLPTAIFASNDLSAFSAMEVVRDAGLSVPDDISVMGFDDIPQASLVYPRLTTVRQPLDQMGRVAVRMLVDRIETAQAAPRRVTLSTNLVIRDSCRPIK
jgi:LacI family transcriptional regulator